MKSYREIFFAYNGPGPWHCDFCGYEVLANHLDVHHRDHDKSNNDPGNLGAAHHSCHTTHHLEGRRGWNHTDKAKAAISTRHQGKEMSTEAKAKISEAKKGKPNPAHGQRVRAAWAAGKYDNRKPRSSRKS